ncbi:MAG: YeaH/YhbH family protein [bacterium]|nr:YeaH/YhbH family protein [Gammaproteobacteria bacterium]HIL97250.1 YeaH/YhbH family protein [Pseudomonadales bacterium]
MSYLIDRRLNAKNKSTVNRQRFLRRYRKQIKKAVDAAVGNRSITDLERGEEISIPKDDINEPTFRHGKGGTRNTIYPGNKEFNAGDRVKRPPQGSGGGGGGDASDSGEGEDEFVFQISQSEFLNAMFEDLELPLLVRKNLLDNDSYKRVQAGVAEEGIPSRLNIVRTMRSAQARRMALTGKARRRLKEVEAKLLEVVADADEHQALLKERDKLKIRINKIPFLDDFDLKYNLQLKQPLPSNKAVMFCIMDVSGSMDQSRKDMAKRFFILLYLFLQRNYEKTDVVFIRHHTSAREVDEEEFFYSRETGGTIVSSALKLVDETIKDRYSPTNWNIYVAQASDGDNWKDDSPVCSKIIRENLLSVVNHFSYVEITKGEHQALWREYETIAADYAESFALRQIIEPNDIYQVFKDLFKRRVNS